MKVVLKRSYAQTYTPFERIRAARTFLYKNQMCWLDCNFAALFPFFWLKYSQNKEGRKLIFNHAFRVGGTVELKKRA